MIHELTNQMFQTKQLLSIVLLLSNRCTNIPPDDVLPDLAHIDVFNPMCNNVFDIICVNETLCDI